MLIVGKLGWGSTPRETSLTKNEQITHITLWSMLAAPLLLGCDLTQLEPFTIDLLSNDEVIAVDQDPLGKAARLKMRSGGTEVWSRPLHDGTLAVGLFNPGRRKATVTAKWSDLGLQGPQPVRDLWQQKDLPDADDQFSAELPRHGAMMLKIGRPASK
jgi:alpha-galactosidase